MGLKRYMGCLLVTLGKVDTLPWYFLHRDIGKRLEVRKTVTACLGEPNHITRLEHAQARLTLSYNRRGDLAIHLVSPMGTRSTLLAARFLPCPLPTLPSPSSPSQSMFSHSPTLLIITTKYFLGHCWHLGGTTLSYGIASYHRNPWLLPI